jgi:hypothetical protein
MLTVLSSEDGADRIIPFGKYKGQPLAVVKQDRGYMDWLAAQDGIRQQYPWIFVTVNNGAAAADTPEHNHYQAMFLEPGFAGDVFDVVNGDVRKRDVLGDRDARFHNREYEQLDIIKKAERVYVSRYYDGRYDKLLPEAEYIQKLAAAERDAAAKSAEAKRVLAEEIEPQRAAAQLRAVTEAELPKVDIEFEVSMRVPDGYNRSKMTGTADVQMRCCGYLVRIEIKPDMGDDYPAVLRQMKASHCNVLYLVNYNGAGATLDQVKRIFAASDILIVEHSLFWE